MFSFHLRSELELSLELDPDIALQEESMPKKNTVLGHERHVLCNCFAIIYRQTLPTEVWLRIFQYLDYFSLKRLEQVSQYFKDCTKAPSNRRTLFTAPFDQKTADGLEEGDLIEIHPAILKFNTVLKKDAKGMGYTSRYKIGNADYDNLSKIRSENAFNPPLNKAKIFETEWTKETLRDFSLNRHLYYLYQVNEDEDKRYLRIGKSKPDTKATLQEEGKAITVGDVLESIIADFEFHPDFQHNSHQWDSMESFLELLRKKGKIPEQIKEDSGWGSPFNWLDHLGRLEQEEWLEHLFRDSSDDLLTYRIWPHLEYRLEKGESADLPLEFGFRLVETREVVEELPYSYFEE